MRIVSARVRRLSQPEHTLSAFNRQRDGKWRGAHDGHAVTIVVESVMDLPYYHVSASQISIFTAAQA